MHEVKLKGITWGHTRGYLPMVATAQRFSELNPNVKIEWHIRSLQSFADQSIADLAREYDLLVIDHPSIGEAATHRIFQPLENVISADFIADQAGATVGASHISYNYNGSQWALAIDAATPVAAWRRDLLDHHRLSVPQTWEEMLELARAGLVCFAGLPLDCLMHWYGLCINEGQIPFRGDPGDIVAEDVGARALAAIKELAEICGPNVITRNPIAAYEAMTRGDDYVYSPLGYGYTNYSRPDYLQTPDKVLEFGDVVSRNGEVLQTTLGGAGLAISARCQDAALEVASSYAQFTASGVCQRTLFTASGGQAGHRSAWLDDGANALAGNFYANTLAAHDRAFVRPRHKNAIDFQTEGTQIMARFLTGDIDTRETLAALNNADKAQRAEKEGAL